MASPCDKIEFFVDGELPADEAEAFRQHLPDCANCQRGVTDLLQLKFLAQRHVERPRAQAPVALAPPVSPARWRRPAYVVSAALAASLVAVVSVRLASTPPTPESDVWLAERPSRLLEARLSHPGADQHRPAAAKMMGGDGSAEELPLGDLALLEKHDPRGLAAAYLVRDDPSLADQALRRLEGLAPSPDVESDRAVAMLLKGRHVEALRRADAALMAQPRHPQALWNRGLALRELGLPLVAARSLAESAALSEPGWAQEATQKAEELRRATTERHARWKAIYEATRNLLDAPPGPLPEGFAQAPISRLHFYDAVRAAPDRERVLALLPVAQQLDAWAGGNVLEAYVRRVAQADFSRRAPLARDYVTLIRKQMAEEDKERFLAALLASREDDILQGALLSMRATARHQARYEAIAAASGDPWFELLAAQERARASIASGRWTQASRTLLDALRDCTGRRGLEYRCIFLERELSSLYIQLNQLDAARTHAELGWRQARATNEWALERDLLANLAQIAQFVKDAPLARALFEELLERDGSEPPIARRVHQNLADIALHELQVDVARREIDAALATGLPLSLSGTFVLADISRMKRGPEDEAHLTRSLEALTPKLRPGERPLVTHVLGRFFIERDVTKGRELLLRAIQEAQAPGLAEDVNARRARAFSYTSLLLEAGRRGAFEEALELFAKERGQELPRQCLLAASVDSERTLLIARGPAGELLGHHDETRRQPLPERLEGLVPKPLLERLRGCAKVEVLARPPLHGRVGLLPSELPWSYLTRTSPPRPAPAGPPVHLVVSEVELPQDSALKRLNTWSPAFGPDEQRVTLTGAEATPSRVLSAMRSATEIDVVAHGLLSDYSDASYLLLAPEQEGPELSVPEVRAASLQGAPFVVLAACHGAHTAYAAHEAFSLPAAFIEAGARGVLAATVEIPDREAQAFFNAIRERMRAGAPPALALRDERVQWLREGKGKAWLDSVLLFE
jgi:hypothetical protein